jgi:hypothetical protein
MAARGRDDKGFLSRWSQRKREAEEAAAREAVPPQEDDEALPAAPSAAAGAAEEDAIDLRDLPDIDSLHAGSDFTVFMRSGIPRALKQRALRRLWQVDPAFNVICPLDDYNLDYTDAATVMPNLKTLYQIGRGMVLPDEEAEQTSSAEDAAALRPGAGESAQASLSSPDVAAEPEQAEEQQRETVEELPTTQAGADESASVTKHRPQAVSPTAGHNVTRSARRRRWGDADV